MAKGKGPTGTVARTSEVKLAPRAAYPSKYDETIIALAKLRPGKSSVFNVKRGDDPSKMQARMKQALRRGMEDFDHKRYVVRRGEGRTIVVVCVKR